jgi:hypothetical protein
MYVCMYVCMYVRMYAYATTPHALEATLLRMRPRICTLTGIAHTHTLRTLHHGQLRRQCRHAPTRHVAVGQRLSRDKMNYMLANSLASRTMSTRNAQTAHHQSYRHTRRHISSPPHTYLFSSQSLVRVQSHYVQKHVQCIISLNTTVGKTELIVNSI